MEKSGVWHTSPSFMRIMLTLMRLYRLGSVLRPWLMGEESPAYLSMLLDTEVFSFLFSGERWDEGIEKRRQCQAEEHEKGKANLGRDHGIRRGGRSWDSSWWFSVCIMLRWPKRVMADIYLYVSGFLTQVDENRGENAAAFCCCRW